jgi:hypothetical protein
MVSLKHKTSNFYKVQISTFFLLLLVCLKLTKISHCFIQYDELVLSYKLCIFLSYLYYYHHHHYLWGVDHSLSLSSMPPLLLSFGLWSIVVVFPYDMKQNFNFFVCLCGQPLILAIFIEKTLLYLLIFSWCLVKNEFTITIRVSIKQWILFYSVPYSQDTTQCLDYCMFVVCLKLKNMSSKFFLLFEDCLRNTYFHPTVSFICISFIISDIIGSLIFCWGYLSNKYKSVPLLSYDFFSIRIKTV